MTAKYIIAENREAAEASAAQHFGVDKSELTFEIIQGEEGSEKWELLALMGPPARITNMDASWKLYYETDGVYLEIYEQRGMGQHLQSDLLMQHISRKSINSISVAAVQSLVAAGRGRIKVAPMQPENIYGEDITIEVTQDEMEARVRLLAGEEGSAALDLETAKQKLWKAGVTCGVDDEALKNFLEAKDYGEPHLIATGTQPIDGEDGKLIFHFSTDERTGRPKEIGGGRVDYRTLDLFEPTTEGQLLVTRTLATEGMPGMSVKGREFKQRPGKECNMPRGKNVDVNPDRTEMHSMCAGMVQFLGGNVTVSNIYKINGDCDLSVGNIDFDGSVQITGSVRSGSIIKATGGISIGGVVEGATIIAGGNIEMKSGMQGSDKGKVEAAGSITALYIERGRAVADGSITVDVCIHSNIETGGTFTAKGKRGAIIGGRVGAAGNVIANYIGAISNTRTEIVVGVVMRKRERIQFLEREIERINGEIRKLDQLESYLEKSKDSMDQETWNKLSVSGVENKRIAKEDLEDFNAEIEDLKYELEHATDGKVHVFNTLYAGSRISIGNALYKVTDEISYATLRFKDGEITYGACELSKAKE